MKNIILKTCSSSNIVFIPEKAFLKLLMSFLKSIPNIIFYLNNFLCLKDLAISIAIFWPALVKENMVTGFPLISFLCLKVLKGRSNFRESGHWGYFEKLKVSGNKLKHSLISLSKSHFSLLEITEYMENRIWSESEICLETS